MKRISTGKNINIYILLSKIENILVTILYGDEFFIVL